MDKISFVLPLKINTCEGHSDLEKVKKILFPSFIKYFNLGQIDKTLVIVPLGEQLEVSRQLKKFNRVLNLSVISEDEILALIPGWERHSFYFRNMRVLRIFDKKFNQGRLCECLKMKCGWENLSGWMKQQLLKLFAARVIDTVYYVTLDADICFIRPADIKTLCPDGKAVVNLYSKSMHYDWWVGSARVLGIESEQSKKEYGMSVTPEILSTRVVNDLIDYLVAKSREKKYRSVFEYLPSNEPWTEYTLYWLFLLKYFKKEEHYADPKAGNSLHSEYSLWHRDQALNTKDLREHIDSAFRECRSFFLIVQSCSFPLEEYYEFIKGYIS